MPELDGPSLLMRLIDVAEHALRGNAILGCDFMELQAAVDAMADSAHWPRCVGDEATMLATALRNRNGSSGELAGRWAMIAGALLPMVKEAVWHAIKERRDTAARPDPEAQPNYRGGASR
jgi:hypothetical protein